jgi:hypothetical protein
MAKKRINDTHKAQDAGHGMKKYKGNGDNHAHVDFAI